ncbi:chromosome segregation protein SMC [Brochothrix thermosphacta]|uniref:chromosome segregation protein SMC n=1 Tax=Brochothrix thermosphacta TaxID=2756 RepID=UPI0039B00373
MQLKRLEMHGFKSFADKVAIDFVPGITAVVGPNGSGKSNVTEAIRWVLGEQSAKALRGGKMSDVIFSGSDSRAAINIAEVTLVFDNEDGFLPDDHTEVSVTRRVYRNGDSEFEINQQACRLKDIVELFMDSGLGRESFSIVSQGKIDSILNSKPTERRSIFEEAAGVLKYKSRKKQAETKLVETEDNLNRVQDILFELQDQVEPLEIQAAIAKDYLAQKETLEKYEVGVLADEIQELTKEADATTVALHQWQSKLIDSKKQAQSLLEQWQAKKDLFAKVTRDADVIQEKLVETARELERVNGQCDVLKERALHGQASDSDVVEQLEAINEIIVSATVEKETQQERYDVLLQKVTVMRESVKQLQNYLDGKVEWTPEKIERLKNDYIDVRHEQTNLKNENVFFIKQQEQNQQRLEKLRSENANVIKNHTETDVLQQEKQRLLAEKTANIESKRAEYEQLTQKLKATEADAAVADNQLYKAYEMRQHAKAKHDTLVDLENDYAGYYQGVKMLLKERQQFPGLIGAVAEQVTIPSRFDTAIDIALGASTQHIIVEDEQTARAGIGYLKSNRLGRATFLPITTIKPRVMPNDVIQRLQQHDGFLGIGADLVTIEPRFQGILGNLLGQVIIADTLVSANQLAKLANHRFRIVTLEGDVVNPRGSMTGGAMKQNKAPLLGRKNEIATLAKQLVQMEEVIHQLEDKVNSLKQTVISTRETRDSLRVEGERLNFEVQRIEEDIASTTAAMSRINENMHIYDFDVKELTDENNSLAQRLAANEAKIAEMAQTLISQETAIEQATQNQNMADEQRAEQVENLTAQKTELAVSEEKLTHANTKLAEMRATLKTNNERREQLQEKLTFIHTQQTEHASSSEQLEASRVALEAVMSEVQTQSDSLKAKRIDVEAELNEVASTREYQLNEVATYEKQFNEASMNLERFTSERTYRLSALMDNYELTLTDALERPALTLPIEEAKKKVRLIKRTIDELGPVNIGAIDEFQRIQTRYNFLTQQQTDLLTAKETLNVTMSEMDEEVSRRFYATFMQIKDQFEKIFPKMFGGGQAALVLTDPEDLLNTGVDIVAQPPGKKLQNLMLLSGGERALTAITLLFAIIETRPVPFCILDEVEAALDEANVLRFGSYMQAFQKEMQFIVITHRKGTMEAANVLYGVTMQESGVSKLVSVRLEEANVLTNT